MRASARPQSNSDGERETASPSRRRVGPLLLFVGVPLVAFLAWFGVRVQGALKTREALAEERALVAKAAADSPRDAGPATAVAGVPERWRSVVALEGTLQPAREADLGFKAGGRVAAIRVRLGDKVRAGDVLATLEAVEAQAQLDAARAQVRAAEAGLALADDGARRTTALVGTGSMAQAAAFQGAQQRALAAAQLDGARAQAALAEANLRNHTLSAPFPGSVSRVPPGPGAIVGPGTPLFHLQETGTLKLAGSVGESDVGLIKVGATVELRSAGRPGGGRLVAVLASVDPVTRRVPVEAAVKNEGPEPLLAGVYVRAAVLGLEEIDVLRVPPSALRPGSQSEVLVVKDDKLARRSIVFARAEDGALLVRRGLLAGERVLLSPSAEAKDGDTVILAPETSPLKGDGDGSGR
ncbi:MAG: efflux RND transporter periplasmic adaptor subunit [Myxococcales bacterium]|nr:efflux RND transporter periplasmic adaptor subunit [Myxococcales bacterium]